MADNVPRETVTPYKNFTHEELRKIFLDSKHQYFKHLCDELGWNFQGAASYFPFREWQAEKAAIIRRGEHLALQEAVFGSGTRYKVSLIKALEEVPKGIQNAWMLLNRRMNHLWKLLEDTQAHDERTVVDTDEIIKVTLAMDKLAQSRYGSLLINNWGVSDFDKFRDILSQDLRQDTGEEQESDQDNDDVIVFKPMDGEFRGKDVQRLLAKWYDPPQKEIIIEAQTKQQAAAESLGLEEEDTE